jgi:hypothetical protein
VDAQGAQKGASPRAGRESREAAKRSLLQRIPRAPLAGKSAEGAGRRIAAKQRPSVITLAPAPKPVPVVGAPGSEAAGKLGESGTAPADKAGRAAGGGGRLGSGMNGTVFFPPLPCANAELDRSIRKIAQTTPLVLKHTELAMGLTAVLTSNYIRARWDALRAVPFRPRMDWSVWRLLQVVRRAEPDDFFVLCLPQVCSNCAAENGTLLDPAGGHVGLYMRHAGKKWDDALPPGSKLGAQELAAVEHLVCGMLLLHGLGITHNDVRRANITVDGALVPRLIDWELNSRERSMRRILERHKAGEERDEEIRFYIDELPDDRRWAHAFVNGFFSDPNDRVRMDWTSLAKVIGSTWEASLEHHPPREAKALGQALRLLRQGSDRHALLAWTILRAAAPA